ncbi:hypothetical protein FUA23_05405 [Neolewinella aurantiaca]|uniref:Outer membrane lipoprotein-sorting protein n=1 Tax=Neolewinella aurantiaca TaxID=2602767 RepID=A0A5C7FKL3_9BACT|nr:DUF6503 family protein [Neolewinella aurantiaca]TXF90535.1 hypothetical protein FUA23_05405 [Neolewinella aurantiaca]
MKTLQFILIFLIAGSLTAQSDAKGEKLLQDVAKAYGSWDKLWKQKDVSFTYDYHYAGTEKRDLSTERYIFEGEHSWAKYTQHDINAAPGMPGEVTQSVVDGKPYIMVGDKMMDDPELLGGTSFLRSANYFWFTMFYKMDNPGVVATSKGQETVNGTTYDIVHVTYDPAKTGKEVNDEYILYVNPTTKLVDRFFFSLPAAGVKAPVILMELDYKKIDGLQVSTVRRVFQPGPDGKLPASPQLVQTLTDIKFNNGFTAKDFMLGK